MDKLDILLVDDKTENLLALEAVLASPEYNLIKASSGAEALKYLLDHDCAIILLDVQMPEMDGFETATIIKQSERSRTIPIIFMTAINQEERFLYQGYKTGAVDYLFKPFNVDILKAKIAVFVELYRAKLEVRRQSELLREADRKQLSQELAEFQLRSFRREQAVETQYRQLMEGLDHAVIWSADPERFNFFFVSPSAERIAGYPLRRWSTELNFWASHLHPDDRDWVLAKFRSVANRQGNIGFEHRFITAGGNVIWLHTALRLEQKSESVEFELRGLSVDITRNKEAEEALRQSEERFRFLADASLILSESLDHEAGLTKIARLAVPRFADWCAIDILDENGEPRRLTIAHPDPDKLERASAPGQWSPLDPAVLHRATSALRTGDAELYNRNLEQILSKWAGDQEQAKILGELKLRSAIVAPIITRSRVLGAITFIWGESGHDYQQADMALVQDLARRAAATIDSARLYRQAQDAIKARDEFLSIASHELKTPLTPLKLHTQTLIRSFRREPEGQIKPDRMVRMIESSDRQLDRLSRLVEELLDVSRINTGKLNLVIEEFDLSELVKDVLDRFRDERMEAQCPLQVEANAKAIGHWDAFRVEQIVINLLTNAIKYAPGKPIRVAVIKDDGVARLIVQDEGMGIAKQDQARIFERFERAVSGEKVGGLGLGLYIVREIVKSLGGSIRVESELGHGSTFIVELPLQPSQPKDVTHAVPTLTASTAHRRRGS